MPYSDSDIVREGQAQRQHELALAKIQAEKEIEMARVAADTKKRKISAWEDLIGPILLGLGAVIVVVAIIVAASWNTQQDRNARDRCVAADKVWEDGQCLLPEQRVGTNN